MKKISHIDDNDPSIPQLVQSLAKERFNDCPPNLKEIDAEQYFSRTTMYTPAYLQFRQVRTDDIPFLALHMSIYNDGSGVAVGRMKGERRFYEFAVCEHKWEITHASNCYREYKCSKCGTLNAIDSSG